MNKYEQNFTLRGLEIASAHLDGNIGERDELVERFGQQYDVQRLADAFTYAAILGVEMAVPARGIPFDAVLKEVQADENAVLLPGIDVPFLQATWLASAVKHGGDKNPQQTAASTMDQPGAVNATFQLMISALRALTTAPGLPPMTAGAWAKQMHELLEQGLGVDG